MLRLALLFFVIAVVAAILGFGTVAGVAAIIAKIFFGIFLFLFFLMVLLVAVGLAQFRDLLGRRRR